MKKLTWDSMLFNATRSVANATEKLHAPDGLQGAKRDLAAGILTCRFILQYGMHKPVHGGSDRSKSVERVRSRGRTR